MTRQQCFFAWFLILTATKTTAKLARRPCRLKRGAALKAYHALKKIHPIHHTRPPNRRASSTRMPRIICTIVKGDHHNKRRCLHSDDNTPVGATITIEYCWRNATTPNKSQPTKQQKTEELTTKYNTRWTDGGDGKPRNNPKKQHTPMLNCTIQKLLHVTTTCFAQ